MSGIIFDLDGVIALTEQIHKKAFGFAFAGFGIDMDKYDWDKDFAGKGHKYIIDTVFGKSPSNDRLIDRWVHYYQIFAREAKPVPGVLEYIKQMKGTPIIIATGSARKSAMIVLDNLGIDLPVIAMEDTDKPKPAPDLFLLAAKVIKVNPEDCIVFEDSIPGIRAGKAARMKVIALTTTHIKEELEKEDPDMIIQDFNELLTTVVYPQFEERS
jgi:HAD superfamily hydrolase (TIGR01509 family)